MLTRLTVPYICFSFLLICSLVTSHSLLHGVDELADPLEEAAALRKRQGSQGTFPVTGITNAGTQPRIEIRQMQQDADMWNLYTLGMRRFMETNQTDKFSYYQICGIHGVPFIPWDNAMPAPGVSSPGYCMHVSNLFVQWHRPYLALFEQTLFQHIVDVANSFPAGAVRDRLTATALRWRLPFWDWAMVPPPGTSTFPDLFRTETVTVTLPNGTSTIHNPFFSYRFHPVGGAEFIYSPFETWTQTFRDPTDRDSDAVSQNLHVEKTLDNGRNSLMNRLYSLFAYYDNFTEFSNQAWSENQNFENADSLESIHDNIHDNTGQNGHMSYLDFSAFDPIFWNHHCMIDRAFAIWQVLHPDSYVEPMTAITQSYTFRVGDVEDIDSPLAPFHTDTSGTMHTSRTVVSINKFGYTYPELANGANASSVKAAVNSLYGSNAAAGSSRKRTPGKHMAGKAPTRAEYNHAAGMSVDGRYRHYTANIISPKFAANSSYAIHIFLGDPEDDPAQWAVSPNLVGTHAIFAGFSGLTSYATVHSGSGSIMSAGTVPLTDGLVNKVSSGDLRSMNDRDVSVYLESNLHWRVAMMDGTSVDPGDVSNLSVTVISAKLEPAQAEDEFPQQSDVRQLTHITKGKPGGA